MYWFVDESGLCLVEIDLLKWFYVKFMLSECRLFILELICSFFFGDWIVILIVLVYDEDKNIWFILCGNLKFSSCEFLDDLVEWSIDVNLLILVVDLSGWIIVLVGYVVILRNVVEEFWLGEVFEVWVGWGSLLEFLGLEFN